MDMIGVIDWDVPEVIVGTGGTGTYRLGYRDMKKVDSDLKMSP